MPDPTIHELATEVAERALELEEADSDLVAARDDLTTAERARNQAAVRLANAREHLDKALDQ